MLFKCVILAVVASSAWARTAGATQNSIHQETARSSEAPSYLGDLRYAYKVYQECAAADLTGCLKLKLVAALDRVARAYSNLPLLDGVSFVKDPNAPVENEVKSEAEIEANLPRSMNEREDALNTLITDRIGKFLESHTLQVKLPTVSDLQRSFNGEERGKKGGKKGGGAMLMAMILGGTMIPLALGALALLAGKALIVSKLALVLAGIIGIKKLLSGSGGSHEPQHEVVVSGGHGHSGWGRSYDKAQAQNLAYNAYAAKTR